MFGLVLALGACFPAPPQRTLLRGQVLYGNEGALAGALVRLVDRTRLSDVQVQTLTMDNGEYRFVDVPPGEYALLFSTVRWIAEASPTLLVTVDGDEADRILEPMVLTPAGALSGEVRAPGSGVALEGVVVNLDAYALQARTDAQGRFDFGRLPVRRYQASAIGPGIVSERPVLIEVSVEAEAHAQIELKEIVAPAIEANRPPLLPQGVELERLPLDEVNPRLLVDTGGLAEDALIRGGRARFTCRASDPDGDDLVYSWQVSGGVVEQLAEDAIGWEAQGGSASIRCTVSDGQGGFVTATRRVDVVDYRLAGAAISGTRVVLSQNQAAAPDFDLVDYDLSTGAFTPLSAPGNQIAPQLFGDTALYASDEVSSGDNPRDVFARVLPAGPPVRLSDTDGAEGYGIGPAGIFYSDNSGSACALYRRDTPDAAPELVFPTGVVTAEPAAECDRVVVGAETVLFREAATSYVRWRILVLATLDVLDAPSEWSGEANASAVNAADAYWVAVPSLREVLRVTEADPSATPETVLTLPELAGSVVASVASDGGTSAASAFDTSGLFGSVRIKRETTTRNVATTGPRIVLGAAGRFVLFGTPMHYEAPPARELYLYDWEAP